MKTADLVLIGAAAAVLGGVIYLTRKKILANPNPHLAPQYANTKAIPLAPGAANGWQYFTDGVAISPDGKYYLNGAEVYNPAGMYQ